MCPAHCKAPRLSLAGRNQQSRRDKVMQQGEDWEEFFLLILGAAYVGHTVTLLAAAAAALYVIQASEPRAQTGTRHAQRLLLAILLALLPHALAAAAYAASHQ
eukprot:14874-Heterococcus_DN1.PRE.8